MRPDARDCAPYVGEFSRLWLNSLSPSDPPNFFPPDENSEGQALSQSAHRGEAIAGVILENSLSATHRQRNGPNSYSWQPETQQDIDAIHSMRCLICQRNHAGLSDGSDWRNL